MQRIESVQIKICQCNATNSKQSTDDTKKCSLPHKVYIDVRLLTNKMRRGGGGCNSSGCEHIHVDAVLSRCGEYLFEW
jgi:hypothetical protein